MQWVAVQTSVKKQFYGNIGLDPVKARLDFATIVDEVVQQFTAKLGVEVSISGEIQARSKEGFDETLQRTIKENCNVLNSYPLFLCLALNQIPCFFSNLAHRELQTL